MTILGYLTAGSVLCGRIDNLLERDHFLGGDFTYISHVCMSTLNRVKPQQQRHCTLAPSQTFLRICAELLELSSICQHLDVVLKILSNLVNYLQLLQWTGSAQHRPSPVSLYDGCGQHRTCWSFQRRITSRHCTQTLNDQIFVVQFCFPKTCLHAKAKISGNQYKILPV